MTLPAIVTQATVQSFALMFVVLTAFFLYFCAIFWAFHTPRLTEQTDPGDRRRSRLGRRHGGLNCAPSPVYYTPALGDGDPGGPAGLGEQRKMDHCMFSYINEWSKSSEIPSAIPV